MESGSLIHVKETLLTPENASRFLIQKVMKADGFEKMNNLSRTQYLLKGREFWEELEDRKLDLTEVIDMEVENIVYGARWHIIDGRSEVDNKFREDTALAMVIKFKDSLVRSGWPEDFK